MKHDWKLFVAEELRQLNVEKISYESVDIFSCAPEEVDLDDNVVATYYVESRDSSLRADGLHEAF